MALNKKLKGATLVETMAAMVILAMSLGVGSMTITRVMDSSDLHRRSEASVSGGDKEGMVQSITEAPYKNYTDILLQIRIVRDANGKELYKEQRLIFKQP